MFWATLYTAGVILAISVLMEVLVSYARWCYGRYHADFVDIFACCVVGAPVLTLQALIFTSAFVAWMAWGWQYCFTLSCR